MSKLLIVFAALVAIAVGQRMRVYNCECGQTSLGSRIFGGRAVAKHNHPWQASILQPYRDVNKARTAYITNFHPTCGASIINNRYILTAAHCFMGDLSQHYKNKVGLNAGGSVEEMKDNADTQVWDIEKITLHPGWNERTLANDIALIKVAKPIPIHQKTLVPVCLPPTGMHVTTGQHMMAGTGLNASQTWSNGDVQKDSLREVDMQAYSDDECRQHWGRQFKADTTICAGNRQKTTCQGDSGGPLTNKQNGRVYQLGIVSYGDAKCGDKMRPTIFTKVEAYTDWIMSVAGGEVFCKNTLRH